MTQTSYSTRFYVTIAVILLVLLTLSVATGELHFGRATLPIAMAIAATKAGLVALFFMHLRHASSMMRLFAVAGLCWMAILLSLTLADVLTRAG